MKPEDLKAVTDLYKLLKSPDYFKPVLSGGVAHVCHREPARYTGYCKDCVEIREAKNG